MPERGLILSLPNLPLVGQGGCVHTAEKAFGVPVMLQERCGMPMRWRNGAWEREKAAGI